MCIYFHRDLFFRPSGVTFFFFATIITSSSSHWKKARPSRVPEGSLRLPRPWRRTPPSLLLADYCRIYDMRELLDIPIPPEGYSSFFSSSYYRVRSAAIASTYPVVLYEFIIRIQKTTTTTTTRTQYV